MSELASVADGMARDHPGMLRRGRREAGMNNILTIGILVFAVSAFIGMFITRRNRVVTKSASKKVNISKSASKLDNRTETV